jgi:hypothetical protein
MVSFQFTQYRWNGIRRMCIGIIIKVSTRKSSNKKSDGVENNGKKYEKKMNLQKDLPKHFLFAIGNFCAFHLLVGVCIFF